MKFSYDLHIHSVLSPCADDLQTPNNILNMCMLKGLNLVAITDHNTLKQQAIIKELISSYNFLYLFGTEVTVNEGFDVLVYFEHFDQALCFDNFLEQNLPNKLTNERQMICDVYDNPLTNYNKELRNYLLINYCDFFKKAKSLKGIIIPAHLDRTLLIDNSYLDIIMDVGFDAIELSKYANINHFFLTYPLLKKYKYLTNSDAHTLVDINEAYNFLELEKLSFNDFATYLRTKNE